MVGLGRGGLCYCSDGLSSTAGFQHKDKATVEWLASTTRIVLFSQTFSACSVFLVHVYKVLQTMSGAFAEGQDLFFFNITALLKKAWIQQRVHKALAKGKHSTKFRQ